MAIERLEFDPELKSVYEKIKSTNPSTLSALKETNETELTTLQTKISACLDSITAAGTWNDAVSAKLKSSATTITDLISKCKDPAGEILTATEGAVTELQNALKQYEETLNDTNDKIDQYNAKEKNEPTKYKKNDDDTTSTTTTSEWNKWQKDLEDLKAVIALKKDELESYKDTCDSLIAQIKGLLSAIDSEASIKALAMKFNKTREWLPDPKEIGDEFDNENYAVKGTETVDADGKVISRTYTVYDKDGNIVQTGTIKYDSEGKEIDRVVKKDYAAAPEAGKAKDGDEKVVSVTDSDGKEYTAEKQDSGKYVIRDKEGKIVEEVTEEDYKKKYKQQEKPKEEQKDSKVVKVTDSAGKEYTAEKQESGSYIIRDKEGKVVEEVSEEDYKKKYKQQQDKSKDDNKEDPKEEQKEDKKEDPKEEQKEDKKDDPKGEDETPPKTDEDKSSLQDALANAKDGDRIELEDGYITVSTNSRGEKVYTVHRNGNQYNYTDPSKITGKIKEGTTPEQQQPGAEDNKEPGQEQNPTELTTALENAKNGDRIELEDGYIIVTEKSNGEKIYTVHRNNGNTSNYTDPSKITGTLKTDEVNPPSEENPEQQQQQQQQEQEQQQQQQQAAIDEAKQQARTDIDELESVDYSVFASKNPKLDGKPYVTLQDSSGKEVKVYKAGDADYTEYVVVTDDNKIHSYETLDELEYHYRREAGFSNNTVSVITEAQPGDYYESASGNKSQVAFVTDVKSLRDASLSRQPIVIPKGNFKYGTTGNYHYYTATEDNPICLVYDTNDRVYYRYDQAKGELDKSFGFKPDTLEESGASMFNTGGVDFSGEYYGK